MSENQLSLYMGRIDPPEVKDDEQYFFVRLKKSEENRSFLMLWKVLAYPSSMIYTLLISDALHLFAAVPIGGYV